MVRQGGFLDSEWRQKSTNWQRGQCSRRSGQGSASHLARQSCNSKNSIEDQLTDMDGNVAARALPTAGP